MTLQRKDRKFHIYMALIRSEKQFDYMILANVISRFGDSIDAIAYSWMVYQLTGSKSWLAVVLGVNMIPTVLFQPFSGALSEFFNKKLVTASCDFLRGGIVCLTGILMISDNLSPWHLLILTFLNSTFESLRIPNGMAMIPLILKKENYKTALSLNQGAGRTAELIGIGCTGAIIGVLGVGGALIIDAMTFFLSGLLLSFIRADMDWNKNQSFQFQAYASKLKEGWLYFRQNRWAVLICAICVILNITSIPIENLQAAYLIELLRLDVVAMSVGSMAMTVGMILGAFSLPMISKKFPDKKLLYVGGALIGFLYFIYVSIGYIPSVSGKYICYAITAFAFGFINSLIGVAVQIIFMTQVPNELIGRISGIFTSLACVSIPAGSFFLAAVSTFMTIRQIYLGTGILTVTLFLIISHSKGMKQI